MTKFVDSLGLKRLVTKIAEAVGDGTWLPIRKGSGQGAITEGATTTASGTWSHAEGDSSTASGYASHAEGQMTIASGDFSHAEGEECEARGDYSHAEGQMVIASGVYSHAQGYHNHDNTSFIDMVGVGGGDNAVVNKNASVIYVGRTSTGDVDPTAPKNGYQYLLDVGGYKGQEIGTDMKSVQEVIADLEKGVAATETMTVEDIREIMSA